MVFPNFEEPRVEIFGIVIKHFSRLNELLRTVASRQSFAQNKDIRDLDKILEPLGFILKLLGT